MSSLSIMFKSIADVVEQGLSSRGHTTPAIDRARLKITGVSINPRQLCGRKKKDSAVTHPIVQIRLLGSNRTRRRHDEPSCSRRTMPIMRFRVMCSTRERLYPDLFFPLPPHFFHSRSFPHVGNADGALFRLV